MNYSNKLILLRYYDFLPADFKSSLASVNNDTVQSFHNKLEQEVFFIPNLKSREKKYLLNQIKMMNEDELLRLERINHCNRNQIIQILKEGGISDEEKESDYSYYWS